MGFLSSLEGIGKTLGDVSGASAVLHAVEHPLNLGNDAKAALVIGSYLLGGPMARGAELGAVGLAGRMMGRRMMEAAPVAEGSALHAAWGIPGMRSPSDPSSKIISRGLEKLVNAPMSEIKKELGAYVRGPESIISGNPRSAAGLLSAIRSKMGGGLGPGEGSTKGMFFNPKLGGLPHSTMGEETLAHRATQAMDPFQTSYRGEPATLSEPYGLPQAITQGRMRSLDQAGPPTYHPTAQSAQQMVENSKPLWGEGITGATPNTDAINRDLLLQLIKRMGYTKRSMNG